MRPIAHFVRNNEKKKPSNCSVGQYWFSLLHRLQVRFDCLLIDERIVLPTQYRQTLVGSLHGWAVMLDICHPIWFRHIHRSIVHMTQGCRQCTEQGDNLKPVIGKQHSLQVQAVVETNEEVQLDFAAHGRVK